MNFKMKNKHILFIKDNLIIFKYNLKKEADCVMSKILVVVDYQRDFVDGKFGKNQAAIDIENPLYDKILNHIRNKELVIFTLDTHDYNYNSTVEKDLFDIHCIKYTDGWMPYGKIEEFFKRKALDFSQYIEVVEKDTYIAFDIPDIIRNIDKKKNMNFYPVNEIELVGVATNICVLHNFIYLTNVFPEIKVTVDEKCCASFDQKLHDSAIQIMRGLIK